VVKIIRHMQDRQLTRVSIPRRMVPPRPRITPNYVMRKIDSLPAFHGNLELPTIDNLLFYRFNPGEYHFRQKQISEPTPASPRSGFKVATTKVCPRLPPQRLRGKRT
jgi:hypothetical protein